MKTFACLVAGFSILSGFAFSASPGERPLLPGLEATEYPRHPSQSDENKFRLDLEKFGDPIGF